MRHYSYPKREDYHSEEEFETAVELHELMLERIADDLTEERNLED